MSFFHDYHPSASGPNDDSNSDTELTLDELDEIGPTTKRNGRDRRTGAGIQLSRLRPSKWVNGSKEHRGGGEKGGNEGEDLEDLLAPAEEVEDTGVTPVGGDDDAPLLRQRHSRSEKRPAMQSRTTSVAHILAKLQSTPREEAEEGYDPGSNRIVRLGHRQETRYPPNAVSNAKYTPWSFLPRTLYNEFSFFFNLYFLLVALSQIIPPLRIGYLSTYVAPLAFVLAVTLGKEALDDIARRRRDTEANSERYTVLSFQVDSPETSEIKARSKRVKKYGANKRKEDRLADIGEEEDAVESSSASTRGQLIREITKPSRDLKVGDIVKLGKDARVPVDAVILKSSPRESGDGSEPDNGGEAFIRTDQLDGETDWKLRLAPALTQTMDLNDFSELQIEAGKPEKNVNEFIGSISFGPFPNSGRESGDGSGIKAVPLTIDNTAWANTVIASNVCVYAAVIYTGPQTRQALSTSASRSKTGLLEFEINSLTKILCALTLVLSVVLVILEEIGKRDDNQWYIDVMRYLILFSTIVPISLRVNLDMGKSVYAWFIQHDRDIPDTVVRTSTIPEDLGRVEYLLSDKTGTLTQNDMQLKKVHVGTVSYANEAMSEVVDYVRQGFGGGDNKSNQDPGLSYATATRSRREIGSRVRDIVLALALCHNVTPTTSEEDGKPVTAYQASSPDEIAIVSWTESVGLRLAHRDRHTMLLQSTHTGRTVARVRILNIFPFTSEGKRMGIILRFLDTDLGKADSDTGPIWFYQKGADTVMSPIVAANDWLDEETANMAREGLRTLVIGRKRLSAEVYVEFSQRYQEASVDLLQREVQIARVVKNYLESDLELLGVSGVEDKLQQDVKPSLELLRNAGIKIWMLTGDKVETARCVAVSAKLVTRGQYIHTIAKMTSRVQALDSLEFLNNKTDACLLIDGESLAMMLSFYREVFVRTAVRLPAVIACRCSPTQKADIAQLIRTYTKKRICCIGDGGNDVSMIQAADVGIGIVGKEGRQASLAADFSVLQFCHITKLLVWHGRNSYKRSAKLAQFVIHRGLIISVCQTVFSVASRFEPIALYRDWLLVGYATLYTMFPVFSLVLDTDIPPQLAHLYPELYAELSTSRSLSYRTFFEWVAISVYQGCAIQILSQLLVGMDSFTRMVSVSYTALVLNELLMVAGEVTTWHWIMAVAIAGTALMFFASFPFLGDYLDLAYIMTLGFVWRVAVILAVSLLPVFGTRIVRRTLSPPNYRKVQQGL